MNAETKLNTLYRIGSRVSLNKEQAKEFVGGRYRLEKLIAEKKIRAKRPEPRKCLLMLSMLVMCFFMLLILKNREYKLTL